MAWIALALLLAAPSHPGPVGPDIPADLAARRIVHDSTDELHRDDREVVVERRYELADGSNVIVIGRYGADTLGPFDSLLDQRYRWLVNEISLSRQAAQQAAIRRPGEREIRIVRDYYGRAVKAGVVD
jgi:hypothetical protein